MCGSATLAIEVSSTSMNVASVTVRAITQGFRLGFQAACGAGRGSGRASADAALMVVPVYSKTVMARAGSPDNSSISFCPSSLLRCPHLYSASWGPSHSRRSKDFPPRLSGKVLHHADRGEPAFPSTPDSQSNGDDSPGIESSRVPTEPKEKIMPHCKVQCNYCPPCHKTPAHESHRDWEMHPSWIAGMEALNAYGDWVSSVVLPIAFQWIEEHKAEVYAGVPEDLKDDVGVVIAAAFKLVKELPAYKNGLEQSAAYEEAVANGTWDSSKTNPVWTGITKKIRTGTEQAFAEQSTLLGDKPEQV